MRASLYTVNHDSTLINQSNDMEFKLFPGSSLRLTKLAYEKMYYINYKQCVAALDVKREGTTPMKVNLYALLQSDVWCGVTEIRIGVKFY